MAKKMLIDAAHPEETRVVVMDGARVDDFDFETQNKKQLRGNIYLAKVTRVEPSLQAAFVEYGGNRHGFLAFSEIHPDYYSIPYADREALKAEFEAAGAGEDVVEPKVNREAGAPEADEDEDDDDGAAEETRRRILSRRYRIQEVIKRRQIMLVQVVKEERGNKGAALTTYLSLAGRYCVLMPNTGRGGGISRKITNAADRKRLKKVASELEVPPGMGLIVRTAGAKRTKTEIKRDYEYLLRAWETIRDTTMRSVAPAVIYEESSLVKRAIRDLYDKDVEDIHVQGESAYKEAKDFVRMLMPSHAKKVLPYKEPTPIFTQSGVERQLETIYSPVVTLRSGGYIVINQTEALVSIDVNSGRATRERNIEHTALRTNLEAAEEAARQMRLRDLAGLIVIDFIDMEEARNDRSVEKRMKDCLRFDRARVQMGKISGFGLLELSRQRRRTGILEGSSHVCPVCSGLGRVRSVESSALRVLRALDEESLRRSGAQIEVRAPSDVAIYILNEKRAALASIEEARSVRVRVVAAPSIITSDFEIAVNGQHAVDDDLEDGEAPVQRSERPERHERPERGERPERNERQPRNAPQPVLVAEADEEEVEEVAQGDGGDGESDKNRRRRRGRRGGKRRRDEGAPLEGATISGDEEEAEETGETLSPLASSDRGGRRRRRRRSRGRRVIELDSGEFLDALAYEPVALPEPERTPEPEPLIVADVEIIPEPVNDYPRTSEPTRPVLEETYVAASRRPKRRRLPTHSLGESPPAAAGGAADAEPQQEEFYEPDLARREKFFSRLSRWGKKP
jgi:ribonuclease E